MGVVLPDVPAAGDTLVTLLGAKYDHPPMRVPNAPFALVTTTSPT